jgi:hypothetical protein
MDFEGKLDQLLLLAKQMNESLMELEIELNIMMKLVQEMDGYSSDSEEEQTFN